MLPSSLHGLLSISSTAPTTLEWITGIGTAAGAVAAAFAAGVAVYVSIIQSRRRRPELRMHTPTVGRELVIAGTVGGGDSAWLRCRVTNAKGRDTAEDVEVTIASVREIRVRDQVPPWQTTPALVGLALKWSAGGQSRLHIPPSGERLLDIAAVIESEARSPFRALALQTAFNAADRRNELQTAEVELNLDVTARNTDASRYTVCIAYDGGWGENIWDHLKVTKLERASWD